MIFINDQGDGTMPGPAELADFDQRITAHREDLRWFLQRLTDAAILIGDQDLNGAQIEAVLFSDKINQMLTDDPIRFMNLFSYTLATMLSAADWASRVSHNILNTFRELGPFLPSDVVDRVQQALPDQEGIYPDGSTVAGNLPDPGGLSTPSP